MIWLTPTRRKAIYAAAAGLGALLVLAGVVTEGDVAHWLDIVGKTLDVAALVMAVIHTDPSTPTGEPAAEYDPKHDDPIGA